ncbi:phasin family protein [Andreprevotia lacus DSM 23236]|jgi:phasin family protein|uniref:Phasin family protein n=1 Tax=Andreprevotia lacus DSM 23236 TaxID=1121001 RepID=A0A1W1X6B9_9NEIS|nr:phasin family protein [Andreprevotia lacus]SMC19268.1 phasin family protein [Andreprevotia lacus DSM 23236]
MSQIQQQAQQQFSDFATENVETYLRFARIGLDSAERLLKLQLETSKTALEESAKAAKAFAGVKDVQEALALRSKLAEASVDQASVYSRHFYEIASQAQAEVSQLVEERTTAFNKNVVAGLDRFVKTAPAGADVAVAAVKSTVQATAAAVDSLTKAAKQVADFADASVKAATTATTDAVKAAAKKTAAAA